MGSKQDPALVLLAAGLSRRYGSPKQLDPVSPRGAALPTYTMADALASGFQPLVVVTRPALQDALEAHFREVLGAGAPLVWVHQTLDDLPSGHTPPPGRERPWGTAHAVLAAAPALEGRAFAVANADDWYGPEAMAAVAAFLRAKGEAEGCLVGYPLEATLSPHGGVSRGRIHLQGTRVAGVEECRDIARAEDGRLRGHLARGGPVTLRSDETVSMNLWGLPPSATALLAERFTGFLEGLDDPTADEFLLSQALGKLAAEGRLPLRLLPVGRRWFGVTHPRDRPLVRARLAALHEDGTYTHDIHLRARSANP